MADDSLNDPFIGINLFSGNSFTTPALPTVASAASNASTINAGLLDIIRREIALQAAQQPLPADHRPTTSTERNRLIAQRHIGRLQNNPRYILPPTALLTDTELDKFREFQRDPMNFSLIAWSDTHWTFPPGHVDIMSDTDASAAAYAALVAQYPAAHSVSIPSSPETLQKRSDIAAFPTPTSFSVETPLQFHDMLQLFKTAWLNGRLFSLVDAMGTDLPLMFHMIDRSKYSGVNFTSPDTKYQIGWVLHTQLLALMLESPRFRKMVSEKAMKPSRYFNSSDYDKYCQDLMALYLRFSTVPGFFGPMNLLQKAVVKGISTESGRTLLEGLALQGSFLELCQTLISSKNALAILPSDTAPPRPPSDKSLKVSVPTLRRVLPQRFSLRANNHIKTLLYASILFALLLERIQNTECVNVRKRVPIPYV